MLWAQISLNSNVGCRTKTKWKRKKTLPTWCNLHFYSFSVPVSPATNAERNEECLIMCDFCMNDLNNWLCAMCCNMPVSICMHSWFFLCIQCTLPQLIRKLISIDFIIVLNRVAVIAIGVCNVNKHVLTYTEIWNVSLTHWHHRNDQDANKQIRENYDGKKVTWVPDYVCLRFTKETRCVVLFMNAWSMTTSNFKKKNNFLNNYSWPLIAEFHAKWAKKMLEIFMNVL